ncbi:YopN family type III secretion system gatekeeper subunit [Oxalobacteraceae bacterium CAVE-383]|nr:YopN family type III secretion system gatekeeper subunit [Oxalobacteraceae bacterium CAVE-383]
MVSISRSAPLPMARPQDAIKQKQGAKQSARLQNIKQEGVRAQFERQMTQGALDGAEDFAQKGQSVADQLQNFVDASDNMSMLAGQFRRFGDLKKSADQSNDNFERVLDEDSHPKAQQIVKIAKMQNVSGDELLRQARSLFPDESDLVIVLREMLRRRDLDEIVRIRLQQALAQAEEEAPPKALKAGINIALKARLFGARLALSALLLRASYRQFLESEEHEVMIYEEWVAAYGHERRALVVEFLESALVADMLAQDPSCSRIEFGNLLGKLNQLKLLRSSESLFIESMLNDSLTREHNDREADWLLFMLGLMQAPQELDALLAATVGERIMLSSHAVRSRLLQTILHACRELPRNLFVEEESIEWLWERFRRLAAVSHRHELMEMRMETRQDNNEEP